MSKSQVHQATLRIERGLELRQYEQDGVALELRANGELLGTVTFSGANVYFQKGRMNKHWNFSKFIEILRSTPSS